MSVIPAGYDPLDEAKNASSIEALAELLAAEDLPGVWSRGDVPRAEEIATMAVRAARLCAAIEHYPHFLDDCRRSLSDSTDQERPRELDHLLGLGLSMHSTWSAQGVGRK